MNIEPAQSQFLICEAEDGELDENLVVKKFFTTAADGKNHGTNFKMHIADLFRTTHQNISLRLQNIYEDEELQRKATHKQFLSVRRRLAVMCSVRSSSATSTPLFSSVTEPLGREAAAEEIAQSLRWVRPAAG